MNHLAHVLLARDDPDHRAGALAGDFVKGLLLDRFPELVKLGLEQHRTVDSFVDDHPALTDLRSALPTPYRRYAGILFDVVADHILARNWCRWTTLDLPEFTRAVYRDIAKPQPSLPDRYAQMTAWIRSQDGLSRSLDPEYIVRTLSHLSGRMRRANPLNEAVPVVTQEMAAFENCFVEVFPDLLKKVRDQDSLAAPFAI